MIFICLFTEKVNTPDYVLFEIIQFLFESFLTFLTIYK